MARVNNISLESALKELSFLVKIFTDAVESEEKRKELELGELHLPKMKYTYEIMKSITKRRSRSARNCADKIFIRI